MKKFLMLGAIVCALSACQYSGNTVVECPSCTPPKRHYEVVTECSDFMDKELPDGSYSQCRHCVNKVYFNGVEVSGLSSTKQVQKVRTVQEVRKHPCNR